MNQQYEYDAFDAILHYIFRRTHPDVWFKPSEESLSAGVCIRVHQAQYRVFPYDNPLLVPFEAAVRALNPVVAVKIRSAAVHSALHTVAEDACAIYVDPNTRIQIIDSIGHLPRADKEQCGAFIRDERVLVVWSDHLESIVDLCADFEEKLIKLVWRSRAIPPSSPLPPPTPTSASTPSSASRTPSSAHLEEKAKATSLTPSPPPPSSSPAGFGWSWRLSPQQGKDAEAGRKEARPIRLFAPVYGGLGMALSLFFIGTSINVLLKEAKLDGSYTRFALIITTPLWVCVSFFFAQSVISNISLVIGPVAQYHENSRYYSALKPAPDPQVDSALPHMTIEMPVYKESLEQVISPSVFSIKNAMKTYARQGGTSSIFIHDDGLQTLPEPERAARIAFYADHNIGWVARPPHGAPSSLPTDDPTTTVFTRPGRFKKASNMNYGLELSLKLEKHLRVLEAEEEREGGGGGGEGEEENGLLEDRALERAVEEMFRETGGRWRPWAANGRSIRIGEIILIVDADTVVPEDCFRDAARELAASPEVAILQHESDVMQVAHHYFENGIAHFTRRINKCISMGTANGEVAPFVGHNAFMRWSALQDAAFVDEKDGGKGKVWSEENVSEDFDMALRLQLKGYIIRWVTYSCGGFKEGVSLTVDDELNRWQKYAYGCNELIFHPLATWWRKGPVTKRLRTFLWSSSVPVHYKLNMMAYMFSYYGIAASALLTLLNYFVLGFSLDIDAYYLHSFEIWLACTAVFPIAGNISFTLLEYRLGHRGLIPSFIENVTWIPFFFFFFGGLSIHLSTALLAHLFSYDITWGATKKEVERSHFFLEVPRIWRRFGFAMTVGFLTLAVMGAFATEWVVPEWRIPGVDWAVVMPLVVVAGCHILFPIVLNPWLMIFSY